VVGTCVSGFSLIELIVVTGIIVVLSGIMLANHNKFGGAITLRNVAYDIALSIRQAQTYGISIRKFGAGAGSFSAGYGMHFEITSPNGYIMFADAVSENGLYDAGESVESFTISGGYHVQNLCATATGGGAEVCELEKLDVMFKRPVPDAFIRANSLSTLYERARVIVESPRGDRLAIIVELTGQISVQNITP
jgi:hypothetical protein